MRSNGPLPKSFYISMTFWKIRTAKETFVPKAELKASDVWPLDVPKMEGSTLFAPDEAA